eukprot:TRINITY_DN43587_c0_g1_i1.p1 TRINITY_DN43587_c0_g1~~TRINITY_DN43587_c0_g1_i1.p1  ORF type:complete len:704 (+),score=87.43 TRINITY_DN43587_c0_g1_i1:136-2247(+)
MRHKSRGRTRRDDQGMSSCSEGEEHELGLDTTTLAFLSEEAAFLTGKRSHGGALKRLAHVTGTEIELRNGNRTIDISGPLEARKLAHRYVEIILAQMKWPVKLSDSHIDGDCSMIRVPERAIARVTGAHGVFLRTLEKEWGVLMLFVDYQGEAVRPVVGARDRKTASERTETLAIFGPRRARRGAQLAAMNTIETEIRGFFTDLTRSQEEAFEDCDAPPDEWGTSTLQIDKAVVPYAWGKNGTTQKKLIRASGCVIQIMGNIAYMSGSAEERQRAEEYITIVLDTLDGPVHVEKPWLRSDVTVVQVPGSIVGFITGVKREALLRREDEWGVVMIFVGEHGKRGSPPPDAVVNLLILSCDQRSRKGAELDTLCAIEWKSKGFCTPRLSETTSEEEDFREERRLMTEVQVSYILGQKGATRKQLAVASGAILQFVGQMCCIAGTGSQRERCKRYIEWLLIKLHENRAEIDTRGRTDVTEIHLKGLKEKGYGIVTGRDGKTLQKIAMETGTWCIVAANHVDVERLCIFSYREGSWNDDGGRRKAEQLFREQIKEAQQCIERSEGCRHGGSSLRRDDSRARDKLHSSVRDDRRRQRAMSEDARDRYSPPARRRDLSEDDRYQRRRHLSSSRGRDLSEDDRYRRHRRPASPRARDLSQDDRYQRHRSPSSRAQFSPRPPRRRLPRTGSDGVRSRSPVRRSRPQSLQRR